MDSQYGCRSCGTKDLEMFLGVTPLADRLVSAEKLHEAEPRFPLQVAFCHECSLVQILETVPPEVLFRDDYPYYSSFSPALLEHSRENALSLIEARKLSTDSLVVELASNDGYLLKNYVEKGIPELGIDSAEGPAKAAEQIGVPTLVDFFSTAKAKELTDAGKQADVIHGNNVLAHVADTNGFVAGIATLLKPSGVAVRDMLEDERDHGADTAAFYEDFSSQVLGVKEKLVGVLQDLKRDGKTIAAYGAAAGSTLINYMGIGTEILEQQAGYRAQGGPFIVPIPDPVIV